MTATTASPLPVQQTVATPPTATAPRIAFRQPVSAVGYIDAAWWPRSRDLETELVPVLQDLASVGREIARVIFDLDYWGSVPRHLTVGKREVKLGGFRNTDQHLITLIEDVGRVRIDVLIIDPETDAATAERAMSLASASGNLSRSADIMALASR